MNTLALGTLAIACLSLVLSCVAYSRAGASSEARALRDELRHDGEAFQRRQRALAEDAIRKLRDGYADTLWRISRAKQRLAQLPPEMSEDIQDRAQRIDRQLDERRRDAREELERLEHQISQDAHATQEAIALRVRQLEGRTQILSASADILRAQRLATRNELAAADDLLDDAVADVREARARLGIHAADDPAFTDIISSLRHAKRFVRAPNDATRPRLDQLSDRDTSASRITRRTSGRSTLR
jgi:chromosome segregation ATPase